MVVCRSYWPIWSAAVVIGFGDLAEPIDTVCISETIAVIAILVVAIAIVFFEAIGILVVTIAIVFFEATARGVPLIKTRAMAAPLLKSLQLSKNGRLLGS